MTETVSLWSWSLGWMVSLGVIFGAAVWSIVWPIIRIYRLLFGKNTELSKSGAPVILAVPMVVVILAGGTLLFVLTQQLAYRFSSVSVENADYVFRTAIGFELARYTRNIPLEVKLEGEGRKSGYLRVRVGDSPEILSIRSEDQFALDAMQKFLRRRNLK